MTRVQPDLQEAFDREAEKLDFRLEPTYREEQRMVGVAIVPTTMEEVVQVPVPAQPRPIEDSDDERIRAILVAWETAGPAGDRSMPATWRKHFTDQVVAVSSGHVGILEREELERALASREFADQQVDYPYCDPRQVRVSNLDLTYIGPAAVVATYRSDETYANGKVFGCNAFAVLMKNPEGEWKVTVVSKRTRFLDFIPRPVEVTAQAG